LAASCVISPSTGWTASTVVEGIRDILAYKVVAFVSHVSEPSRIGNINTLVAELLVRV